MHDDSAQQRPTCAGFFNDAVKARLGHAGIMLKLDPNDIPVLSRNARKTRHSAAA
jgi:hypothetical protein